MMLSAKFFIARFWQNNNLIASARLAVIICLVGVSVSAQQTSEIDHLTPAEDDLVHDVQELDKRIAIYVKVIDRRFLVLNGATATKTEVKDGKNSKKKDKDDDKWGELPSGTRPELLLDIKSVLEEAVSNIDNAAEHDAKNAMLPKALKTLADGCSRFAVELKPFYDSASSEAERATVYDAMENCREVIEASSAKHGASPTK